MSSTPRASHRPRKPCGRSLSNSTTCWPDSTNGGADVALYPKAIKRLIPLDPKMDPPITARVVILHVAATETTSLAPYFTSGSGGVESHFYVRYDGSVEQYRDTAYQADANVMANGFAISIETQGLANGTWTDAQLDAIKALLTWCHDTHGIPLEVCPTWDGSGVGYHILFEDQWDQRHASCPGPNRINQFNNVLVPWMAAGDTPTGGFLMALTDQQQTDLYNRVMGGIPAGDARGAKNPGGSPAWVLSSADGSTVRGDHARILAAIQALASGLGPAVEAAVAKALAASYDATLTLSRKGA